MLSRYLSPETVTGLHIHFDSHGEKTFALTRLKKTKGDYTVDIALNGFSTTAALKEHIPEGTSLAVIITGKGTLNKLTDDKSTTLDNAIPGFRRDEYYVQKANTDNTMHLYSLCRKQQADGLLRELGTNGYKVISLALGLAPLSDTCRLITHHKETNTTIHVRFAGTGTTLSDDHILSFGTAEENKAALYTVTSGDTAIHENDLPSYIACLYFLQALAQDKKAEQPDSVTLEYTTWKTNRVLKAGSVLMLVIWFSILLINFLGQGLLTEKNTILNERYKSAYLYISKRDSLEKKTNDLEYFMSRLGIDRPSRFAYYADRIAASLPSAVSLTRLRVEPPNEKSADALPGFQRNKIFVSGNSTSSLALNDWINSLGKQSWIGDAALKEYSKAEDKNTGAFEVIITLK